MSGPTYGMEMKVDVVDAAIMSWCYEEHGVVDRHIL